MSTQKHLGLHEQKQPNVGIIPSPPTSDNEHDFSLTDLLKPTMTLEQIKIIEMALAKIKSKRDALLSNEQQGSGNTILAYDWTLVAKQMAKALTTTCNNNKKQQPLTNTSSMGPTPPPSSHNGNSSMTGQGSTNTSAIPTTDTSSDSKPPTDLISTVITTPPASPPSAPCVVSSSPTKKDMAKDKPTRPEPQTEIKDGVEWVSFVYSHHRVVRRYRIRTDLDTVELDTLDEQFRNDNCVYPRANLPREAYQGNRWSYETECNTLGWKLAYLNMDEIAGKRGLIQRAVDSYRNRYPSMRSRRVARQEKLLKGTLRKRKQSPVSGDDIDGPPCKSPHLTSESSSIHNNYDNSTKATLCYSSTSSSPTATSYGKIPSIYPFHEKSTKNHPKTVTIDDRGVKCRIRINIDTIDLSVIDDTFRKNNCVFPRAMNMASSANLTQRRQDEAKCNEIGWKLAWLNPKHLAGKKNLLQRILDIYRIKFVPHLAPRQSSHPLKLHTELSTKPTPLTAEALAAHHQQQEQEAAKNGFSDSVRYVCKKNDRQHDDGDNDTIYTGTTDSLDFQDCFSPPPEAITASSSSSSSTMDDFPTFDDPPLAPMMTTDPTDFSGMVIPPPPPMMGDEYFESVLDPLASPPTQSLSATLTSSSDLTDDVSCHLSVDSCHNSPSQRYISLGSYGEDMYSILDTVEGNQDHMMTDMYIFDTKASPTPSSHHLLPTDIFAAQDMDWTSDVKDCILADLHSDVLVHQLFLT
ncbi:hypothetical protein BC941DRAFT_498176 [Chlamydoabsidia padenii]|nr:hypothetical protein BC941DRAFT_498176 [Chlamydoabsidia padenii]